ncbi:long-chain-fatty-acid--CoA ligase 6 isoform X5 [Pangasianodon hypophthalmus]|uniref:long-chain-fatty-acid--CoA ligase 6 isoform X5 n=1 Tax=Pangasianodon hypophthalmus TaxID=310915 RepID=UPI0023080DE8|nr:long-chain-fatty-acid--CoA ligase 6 isoform X5 [Pangasianodon hypophthalmus]
MTPAMFAFALMAGSLWIILELSTTLIERMQVQELVLSLWLSELEKLFHRICSTPTTVLFGLGALTAMFAFWLATRPRALMPPCDLHHQSEEVEGGGHRSMLVDDPKLFTRYYEDTKTLYEAFQRGLHITGDGPCLGSRLPNQPYKWLSYREALGQEHYRKPMPPCSEDLSIICFTSGTTGNPKGVMLTHGNIVADFSGFLKATDKVISPNQEDVLISFLPLAHMFERLIEAVVYCHGGRIGFFQGDIRLLSDDMKALRPTVFPVVPRLLNRMYDKIFTQANTPVKRWLLNFAAKKKGEEVSSGIIRNNSIWDKIFFSKIQANLGGRLRMVITGAAPTSPTVLSFLRAALGCQVYEAYGQTECTAGCTFTTPGDWTSGHVGAPLPCNIIKLVDVPEKNYFTSKGEGEVCVKGPNVFKGYLKDPAMTAETLDSDGWLHTGDIGQWLPNGTLKIIDRKKHIFKLAQGEYISPEKIENIYIRSEPVSQLYVHGDSLQSCLVGIVVPDPEVMPSWAQKKGIDGCYDGLCKNVELKKAILDDMVCLGKAGGLHSFEQVKDIYIHNEMFSIENGLLTPTLKAKRPELKEYFKQQIEHLYDNITM